MRRKLSGLLSACCLSALIGNATMRASLHGAMDGQPPLRPKFRSVPVDQVKLGGELGRRIALTVRENFLVLNIENDFLRPLRHRQPKGTLSGYGR